MKYKLAHLKTLNLEQLKEEFYAIEDSDDVLELDGDDYTSSLLDYTDLPKALTFLPPHISQIIFKGKFQYLIYQSMPDNAYAELHIDSYRYVGNYLPYLMSYIPVTVENIKFSLKKDDKYECANRLYSKVSRDMYYVLNKLPAHVRHLDLTETFYAEDVGSNWKDVLNMYLGIPRTIQSIRFHQSNWENCPPAIFNHIFQYLNLFIQQLHWENVASFLLEKQNIQINFVGQIRQLSFRQNIELFANIKAFELIKKVPKNITSLNLAYNQFEKLTVDSLCLLFANIPNNIYSLDLGENGLVTCEPDFFHSVIGRLPESIKCLRLIDNIQNYHSLAQVLMNYRSIPAHVHTLSFSDSRHLRVKSSVYRRIFQQLPPSIQTLDFSASSFFEYDLEDIEELCNALPSSIKTLVFRKNLLASMDLPLLRSNFSKIPLTVKEIDIAGNGLDKLKYSSLAKFINVLPDRTYHFQNEKICLTHDGRLMPYYPRSNDIYFKPVKKLRLQNLYSQFFLCTSQFMHQKKLSLSIFLRICSFLNNVDGDTDERLALESQLTKASLFVTNTRNYSKSQILSDISKRISININSTLDLSHAGLSGLNHVTEFIQIFQRIPKEILKLNLRKNDLNKPSVFKAFCGALHQLPSSILYLDLSGNGFNSTDYNLLSQFSRLPKTLKFISFGLERPVDLQAQMNKAFMPAYLPRLINQPLNVMQKAQLLLNDYTQGNSWFWRTIYGYS